jgi:tetratricopeptide (TPR) repeat protein
LDDHASLAPIGGLHPAKDCATSCGMAATARIAADRQLAPMDAEYRWLGSHRIGKALKAGRFDEALALANREVKKQPDSGPAYAARACVLIEGTLHNPPVMPSGEISADAAAWCFNEALADCNRAIELEPKFGTAFALRAIVSWSFGQADEAKESLERAAAVEPGNQELQTWVQGLRRRLLGFDESKTPGYTGHPMGDTAHDLNALAANLGLSFEVAAAKLTEAARAESDPLRRARRVVRSYQRRRAKNPDYQPSREVLDAFSIINKGNYRRSQAKAKLAT